MVDLSKSIIVKQAAVHKLEVISFLKEANSVSVSRGKVHALFPIILDYFANSQLALQLILDLPVCQMGTGLLLGPCILLIQLKLKYTL